MAKCKYCGANAGFVSNICPSCLEDTPPESETGQEQQTDTSEPIPSKYGTARGVSGFGEFVGWLLVATGILLGFVALTDEKGVAGLIVAAAACIAGLYLVMAAQFVRATVDNADTNREILRLLTRKK